MMTVFATTMPKAAVLGGMTIAVIACVLVCSPYGATQVEQTTAWLQGFNRTEWDHGRPERACNYIKARLQHATREKVVALLGKPDQQNDAGEGMWGPYDAYYSYVLDNDPAANYRRYVWNTLDISFAPAGNVSKIEVRSHCY
jgi:hypothetical protein